MCAAGVGVITPYRYQQNMIRKMFRNYSDTMVCPFRLTSMFYRWAYCVAMCHSVISEHTVYTTAVVS